MNERANSDVVSERLSSLSHGPHELLLDRKLSTDQKTEALGTLEQDARQLSQASSEGMAGDQDDKLQDVLDAKDEHASSIVLGAYDMVLEDLRSRRKHHSTTATKALLDKAIVALEGLIVPPRRL